MRATTDGPASITYTDNGSEVHENISGPWEKTVELTDLPAELSLVIESNRPNSAVGCEIIADDVQVRNSSSGGSVTATCRTTVP